jgi:acyl-CoA thioester hydrolase
MLLGMLIMPIILPTQKNPELNILLILASATVDYLIPLLLNDKLLVYVRCSKIGNKSFEMEYLFFSDNENRTLKAKVRTVLVAFNYLVQKSIQVPQSWRQKLTDFDLTGN